MNDIAKPTASKARPAIGGAIIAVLAIATPFVAGWEGTKTKPYLDVAKVWTVCTGETNVPMREYTPDQCRAFLNDGLTSRALEINTCVPGILQRPKVAAASLSLAYNIGTVAFCRSTAARRFNAGDLKGGCEAIGWFTRAGGKVVQGLVNRRRAEVKLCLEGVA